MKERGMIKQTVPKDKSVPKRKRPSRSKEGKANIGGSREKKRERRSKVEDTWHETVYSTTGLESFHKELGSNKEKIQRGKGRERRKPGKQLQLVGGLRRRGHRRTKEEGKSG